MKFGGRPLNTYKADNYANGLRQRSEETSKCVKKKGVKRKQEKFKVGDPKKKLRGGDKRRPKK